MRRRVSYALRTLIGPWLAVPAVVLESANFVQRGMPWRGEGMWTVEWFAISLFIIGPLCMGAAAVDASRLSRPGNIHLALATPSPYRTFLRAAMWCAGPLVVVHLAAIAAGVVAGGVQQPSVGWAAMAGAVLVQCLAIVWYAAIGSAIGRFTPPVLAGLAGGGGGFVLFYVLGDATPTGDFALLALGGATVSRLGLAYHPGYLAGQAAVFALTAGLLLMVGLRTRSGFRVPTLAGAASFVLVIATVVAAPAVLPDSRYLADPRPPELCLDTTPPVCVHAEHRRYLDELLPHIDTLVEAAALAGYPALVPERIVESSRTYYSPHPNERSVSLYLYETGEGTVEDLAGALVTPLHCPQLYADEPPGDAYWERWLNLWYTWLSLIGAEGELHSFYSPDELELYSPETVELIMADFARCALDVEQ